ncbi:Werner Syndrome-like exonuclease [Impatiens glandulifera]|uniref:Werner Syndrome-like exonuclease n=1 Tax=Impatiens glandulifera TaxID=253017 RepID=UPI001FB15B23|nr:Werner Syndrome-like exonuclease [Impatiens glandulifera]
MAMESSIFDHRLPVHTHDLYTVNFYDDSILTTVTHTPSIVENWISEMEFFHRRRLNRLIIGLDVEWRPMFGRHSPYSPVATIQLCIGHRCLIFQLIYASYIPDSLIEFLNNPNYTFVGVGIENDVKKLENDYQLGIEPSIVDLAELAADRCDDDEFLYAGLKKLTSMVLDLDVVKPRRITLSRWDDLYLSDKQVQYACIDAFLSFEIGRVLKAYDF